MRKVVVEYWPEWSLVIGHEDRGPGPGQHVQAVCGRRQQSHDPLIEPFLQWAASPSLCWWLEWKWPGNEGMALLYCTLHPSDSDIDAQMHTMWETVIHKTAI